MHKNIILFLRATGCGCGEGRKTAIRKFSDAVPGRTSVCALLVAFLLAGCGTTNVPYSLAVGDYNYRGKQEPAAITLSDPQIYARESLVNDRLRESLLVEALLDESACIQEGRNIRDFECKVDFRSRFGPQMLRDIESVRATLIGLGINLAGKGVSLPDAAKDDPEEDEASGEGEGESGTGKEDEPDKEDGDQAKKEGDDADVEESESEDENSSSLEAVDSRLKNTRTKLQGAIDNMRERLGKLEREKPKADPRDEFRDLQAYRHELRQTLASVNLDDLHDFDGNALYRLQFQANVNPGRHRDKLGVARLTILPPDLDVGQRTEVPQPGAIDHAAEATRDLYRTWLLHLTRRMNQQLPRGRGVRDKKLYTSLSGSGMFTLFYFPYSPNEKAKTLVKIKIENEERKFDLCPFLEPSDAISRGCAAVRAVVAMGSTKIAKKELRSVAKGHPMKEKVKANGAIPEDLKKLYLEFLQTERESSAEPEALLIHGPSLVENLRLVHLPDEMPQSAREVFEQLVQKIGTSVLMGEEERVNAAAEVRRLREKRRDLEAKMSQAYARGKRSSPEVREKIQDLDAKIDTAVNKYSLDAPHRFKELVWAFDRGLYAYDVAPKELAQRLSTSARSANSFQMALSVAASYPGAGVGGGFNFGHMRAAAANVEALERTPRVVGFSDRAGWSDYDVVRKSLFSRMFSSGSQRPKNDQSSGRFLYGTNASEALYWRRCDGLKCDQLPQVGWVFAPPVRVNAGKKEGRLEYQHVPASFDVSADVSVPGWWPYVTAVLETAWVGNWNGVGQVIRNDRKSAYHYEVFKIGLPLNPADLDALTNYISKRTVGSFVQPAQIDHVEPFFLSACQSEVELLIAGANIWRATEVYLGGRKAEGVRVLPDMEGVAARFKLDSMFDAINTQLEGLGLRQDVPLTVWTRSGSDTTEIVMTGSRSKNGDKAECDSPTSLPSIYDRDHPALTHVSPSVIPHDAAHIRLAMQIANADKIGRVKVGNKKVPIMSFLLGASLVVDKHCRTSSGPCYETFGSGSRTQRVLVKFEGPLPEAKTQKAVTLTLLTDKGISQRPIRLSKLSGKAEPKPEVKPNPYSSAFISEAASQIKGTVRFAYEGALPLGKVRIGVLPLEAFDGSLWVKSKDRPDRDVSISGSRVFMAAFASGKPDVSDIGASFQNGGKMRLALIVLKEGGAAKVVGFSAPMVFYADADSASAKLVKTKTGKDGFTLKFPASAIAGFPGLKVAHVAAKAGDTDLVLKDKTVRLDKNNNSAFEFKDPTVVSGLLDKLDKDKDEKLKISVGLTGAIKHLLPELTASEYELTKPKEK